MSSIHQFRAVSFTDHYYEHQIFSVRRFVGWLIRISVPLLQASETFSENVRWLADHNICSTTIGIRNFQWERSLVGCWSQYLFHCYRHQKLSVRTFVGWRIAISVPLLQASETFSENVRWLAADHNICSTTTGIRNFQWERSLVGCWSQYLFHYYRHQKLSVRTFVGWLLITISVPLL